MMNILFLLVGLFLGWFFLPTPNWAKALLSKFLAKFPFLAAFVKKD